MRVEQHMKTDVKTCKAEETVLNGVRTMAQFNIGSLIVVEDRYPVGIFTERDLVKKVVALSKDPAKMRIGDVMTRRLIFVDAGQSVGAAYHVLVENNVRHAPVVKKGKLVGIVSQKDFAKILDERFYRTFFGREEIKPDLSGDY